MRGSRWLSSLVAGAVAAAMGGTVLGALIQRPLDPRTGKSAGVTYFTSADAPALCADGEVGVLITPGSAPTLQLCDAETGAGWTNVDASLTVGTETAIARFGAADLEDSNLTDADPPAAGASGDLTSLIATVAAMDATGSDVVRALLIDLTNADHTGGTLVGLYIDDITGDAQAQESAIWLDTGWDDFVSSTATISFDTTSVVVAAFQRSGTNVLELRNGSTYNFLLTGQMNAAADSAIFDSAFAGAMDGSDDANVIVIDTIADGAHSGVDNYLNAIDVEAITSPDADAIHVGVRMGTGWDGLALMQCEYTAWPANFDPVTKTGVLWCREGIAATQDCAIMFHDAGGTDTVVQSITTNAVCP